MSFTLYNLIEQQSLTAYSLDSFLTSSTSTFSVREMSISEVILNSYLYKNDSSGGIISSNIIPAEDATYNLGSPTSKFNTVYLSSNTLIIGDIPLSSDENSLIIGTPEQEISLLIPSGKLDIQDASIVADPEGNLELPASTTVAGTLTGTIHILNIFNNISSLPVTANLGDAYIIGSTDIAGDLYVCTDNVQNPNIFTNIGPIQGPDGKQGPQGLKGPQGMQNGLFTLIAPPTIGTSPNQATIISPNSIKSTVQSSGPLWNGRIQTLTGYNNTPFYLSFTIPAPALQPPASPGGYCVIGISSDPGNANTNDYNGYFNAGFVIQQSTFQLVVNKSGTPSAPSSGSSNAWTNNSTFIIIFDGYYFNFYITNTGQTLQVFSYLSAAINQPKYYFTASFAGGPTGYTTNFLVSNIVFSPYALLNPRNYFGNTNNNNMWTAVGGGSIPYPSMQANNTYIFSQPSQSIVSSNAYGSTLIYNATTQSGYFSTPLEGFVFSIVAPETYGNNILVRITGGSSGGNVPFVTQYMTITLNNYIAKFNSAPGGIDFNFTYNVGDVISVYYNPINNVSNLYIYNNQFIIGTSNTFGPIIKCTVTIVLISVGVDATPIVVLNPLFYKYGNLALHL